MPEIDELLLRYFTLSGMYLSSGMGISRLTWTEVENFSKGVGYPIYSWEKETIVAMSQDYCSSYYKSATLGSAPPYNSIDLEKEESIEDMRKKVAKQWASFENGFNKSNKKAR